jgi:hypothetical protein
MTGVGSDISFRFAACMQIKVLLLRFSGVPQKVNTRIQALSCEEYK